MNQHPDFIIMVGIAIGLSMDALAVSVANGAMVQGLRFRQALRIAFFFGLFQAIMPLIGWAAGTTFNQYINRFDHWIAFGLLFIIGGRMVIESFSGAHAKVRNCLHFPTLLMMSLATSIDALAVGVSFAMLNEGIWYPILIIGVITFFVSMLGIRFGKSVGPLFGKRVEMIGGLVLIGIGFKILTEHLANNL